MKKTQIVVTGSNRGIGLEFVKQYLAEGAKVTACVYPEHDSSELTALANSHNDLMLCNMDITKDADIEMAAKTIEKPIDILINNVGVHGGSGQSMGCIKRQAWLDTFVTNTLSPFFVTRALLPLLQKGSKIAFLSSKMGSISDNNSGQAYIYRTSKTALNAVIKSLGNDLKEREIAVFSVHPGWVKTSMGGPDAPMTVEESVSNLRFLIEKSDLTTTGSFFNYAGLRIPW